MAPKDDDKPVELLGETESKKINGKKELDKKSSPTKKKKGKSGGGDNGDLIEDDDNVLSEEDRELKERLETCVSTLINEANELSVTPSIRLKAMEMIVTELRNATSSMTSVPKPLKFLRPKFDILKRYYGSIVGDSEEIVGDKEMVFLRARLADVLAVLAMTLGKHGELCLWFLFWHGPLLSIWLDFSYFVYNL
jgi:26S proteasome regulatory subunit N1